MHCASLACDVGQITAKLDAIEQRMANRRGRSARDGDDAEQSPQADDDEEDERAAWLLRIQSAVYKAIDLQPLLATEAALLASRPVVTPQMNAATQAAGGEPRATAPSMVVIDSLSRVSLTSERERMRGEVFRPSHILPTMTIEQFGACSACLRNAPRIASRGDTDTRALQGNWSTNAWWRRRLPVRRQSRRPGTRLPARAVTMKQRRTQSWPRRGRGTTGRCVAIGSVGGASLRFACRVGLKRVMHWVSLTMRMYVSHVRKDDHKFGSGNSRLRPCGR
jgi:hypothetical protein